MGVDGGLLVASEDSQKMVEDGVCDDVFLNLRLDDLGVVLIDFYDLLDVEVYGACQDFFDSGHGWRG